MGDVQPLLILLVVCAAFTSFVTASIGVGGGVMLLAIMAQILPPEVIIPVHGIVQLGSNFGRATMSARHIDWHLIAWFAPGAIVGGVLGSFVIVTLPPQYLYLSIGLFTLFLCWSPKLPAVAVGRAGTTAIGGVTTFLTLFVGATGPIVGAFINQRNVDRFAIVATFAAAMSIQHMLKAGIFQSVGFDLRPWIGLTLAMIATGAIGTWTGLKLLKRFPDRWFRPAFRIVLSLLALRLLWQAFG